MANSPLDLCILAWVQIYKTDATMDTTGSCDLCIIFCDAVETDMLTNDIN